MLDNTIVSVLRSAVLAIRQQRDSLAFHFLNRIKDWVFIISNAYTRVAVTGFLDYKLHFVQRTITRRHISRT